MIEKQIEELLDQIYELQITLDSITRELQEGIVEFKKNDEQDEENNYIDINKLEESTKTYFKKIKTEQNSCIEQLSLIATIIKLKQECENDELEHQKLVIEQNKHKYPIVYKLLLLNDKTRESSFEQQFDRKIEKNIDLDYIESIIKNANEVTYEDFYKKVQYHAKKAKKKENKKSKNYGFFGKIFRSKKDKMTNTQKNLIQTEISTLDEELNQNFPENLSDLKPFFAEIIEHINGMCDDEKQAIDINMIKDSLNVIREIIEFIKNNEFNQFGVVFELYDMINQKKLILQKKYKLKDKKIISLFDKLLSTSETVKEKCIDNKFKQTNISNNKENYYTEEHYYNLVIDQLLTKMKKCNDLDVIEFAEYVVSELLSLEHNLTTLIEFSQQIEQRLSTLYSHRPEQKRKYCTFLPQLVLITISPFDKSINELYEIVNLNLENANMTIEQQDLKNLHSKVSTLENKTTEDLSGKYQNSINFYIKSAEYMGKSLEKKEQINPEEPIFSPSHK